MGLLITLAILATYFMGAIRTFKWAFKRALDAHNRRYRFLNPKEYVSEFAFEAAMRSLIWPITCPIWFIYNHFLMPFVKDTLEPTKKTEYDLWQQ